MKGKKNFIQRKIAMCNNPMGFPFCYSLRISGYLVYLLLHPKMIELIRNFEFVSHKSKVFRQMSRRDIVICFSSLTFSWTALSGFQSTGKPFFAQVALSGFQLAGCTEIFFILSLIFARTFLVRRDALFA